MEGFRNTDLGILPSDWKVDLLGSLNPFVTSGSRGWARYYADRGAPFVRITNLSRGSVYLDIADLKMVNLPPEDREGLRTQLQSGDLLVSITADIGIIGYVDSRVRQPAYINQHIALVRCDPSVADTKFLAYFLASWFPQRAFRAATDQGAKAGMNLAGVLRIQAAFPPLPEQRAIATALSDVDALLGGLDRLIAKKRDLKQAAMQQLLTGQARLPGFHGEWEAVEFGDIASIRNAKVPPSSTPAGTQCVELESIGQGTGRLLMSAQATGLSSKYSFRQGDILFGRLRAYLRKYWLATFDGVCSTEIWPLVARDERLSGSFLHLLVQTNDFVNAAGVSYGTHMPRSDWSVLKKFPVHIPPVPEQTAIAAVLSDMDSELAALEARRCKTCDLKQAMMQELLTGKTRLVPAGVTHA